MKQVKPIHIQLAFIKRLVTTYILAICYYLEKYTSVGCGILDLSKVRIHQNNYLGSKWHFHNSFWRTVSDLPVLFSIPIKTSKDAEELENLQNSINNNLNITHKLFVIVDKNEKVLKCYSKALNNRLMMYRLMRLDLKEEIDKTINSITMQKDGFVITEFLFEIIIAHNMLEKPGIYVKLKSELETGPKNQVEGIIEKIDEYCEEIQLCGVNPNIPVKYIINDWISWYFEDIRYELDESDIILERSDLAKKIKSKLKGAPQSKKSSAKSPSVQSYTDADLDIPY